tara:strand:- start:37111 stop:37374 length:264 start_codon:yes stop_codon:yes gene_type:complete
MKKKHFKLLIAPNIISNKGVIITVENDRKRGNGDWFDIREQEIIVDNEDSSSVYYVVGIEAMKEIREKGEPLELLVEYRYTINKTEE